MPAADMPVAVDLSLYPLDSDFVPPIRDIIARLDAYPDIAVVTNPMSTQLRGDFGIVMDALKAEMGSTFERLPKAVFAIRILNNPLSP